MKRSVTFLTWIAIVLLVVGCGDRPLVGQRVAKAEKSAPGASLAQSTLIARRVMVGADADTNGFPSPDGRSWVHYNERGILVRDLATGQDRVVVPAPKDDSDVFLPKFSHDGSRIEYIAGRGEESAPYAIRTVGLDGTGGSTLFEGKLEGTPFWLPIRWTADAAYILTRRDGSPATNGIGIISTRDRRTWVLKTFDWRVPGNVSFSPEGRSLAYDFPPDEKSPNRDVFVIATDGSRETIVSAHPADERLLGWTPEGGIMFSSNRTGTPAIYVASVANGRAQGTPQLVKKDFFRVSESFGITSNGSLFYQVQPTARNVLTMTLDPATLRVLVPPAPLNASVVGQNEYPRWSPDGRSVAYVSYPVPRRAGGQQIVIQPVDAGDARVLNPEMNYIGPVRWTPDGRAFIADGEDPQNRTGLFRIDAHTGAVTALRRVDRENGVLPIQGAAGVSLDGRSIVLTVRRPRTANDGPNSATWALVALDFNSRTEREIRRFPGLTTLSGAHPSPDGTQLLFTTSDESRAWRLYTMPTEGGEPKEIYRAPDNRVIGGGSLNWMPGRRVLFLTREKAPSATNPAAQRPGSEQILSVHLDGGPTLTSDFDMPENIGTPRVHPDGRRFVFEYGLPTYEIWALDGAAPAIRSSVSR